MRILIAEDDPDLRDLLQDELEDAGYDTTICINGQKALEQIEKTSEQIDLLLTDIMMPGGTGIELAGKLVGQRPRLSVLYMSGYTDDAVIRNGMLARGSAFIQKPFTPKELLRRVKQILELGV